MVAVSRKRSAEMRSIIVNAFGCNVWMFNDKLADGRRSVKILGTAKARQRKYFELVERELTNAGFNVTIREMYTEEKIKGRYAGCSMLACAAPYRLHVGEAR